MHVPKALLKLMGVTCTPKGNSPINILKGHMEHKRKVFTSIFFFFNDIKMLQFGNKFQTGRMSNGRNFPPVFKLQFQEIKLLLSKLEIIASQQSSYISLLLRKT